MVSLFNKSQIYSNDIGHHCLNLYTHYWRGLDSDMNYQLLEVKETEGCDDHMFRKVMWSVDYQHIPRPQSPTLDRAWRTARASSSQETAGAAAPDTNTLHAESEQARA